jgi:hypothetical protein
MSRRQLNTYREQRSAALDSPGPTTALSIICLIKIRINIILLFLTVSPKWSLYG